MSNPSPQPWDTAQASDIIAGLRHLEGSALPILHALNAYFGHVPDAAVPLVAQALNLSRADVHGIVSFYHDFRRQPAGRTHLRLCRGEACQSMGSETLAKGLLAQLGLDWGETSADGAVTIDPVYCLGLCACAPAALVNCQPIGRLDADTLVEIMGIGGAA